MAPAKARRIKLMLRGVRIEGSTVFSNDDLQPLYAKHVGKRITLADVFAIAADITALYGKQGYILSRAIVPPQALAPSGAVVRFSIIEGYVDQVVWPEGIERYRNYFTYYAEQITSERPIRAEIMERYLLLANDLPGLTFQSHLKASTTNVGASTMVISLKEKLIDASVSVDNRGTDGSGPIQVDAKVGVNNALGLHERVEVRYVTAGTGDDPTARPELHYIHVAFSKVLSGEGLTLELSGNASLGDPDTSILNTLEFESQSRNATVAFMYPIIRTRPENLTGRIAFDFKNSESEQLGAISTEDRLRIFRGEVSYDKADEFRGVSQIVMSASHGIDGLGSTDNDNPRASRSNGKVDFWKATIQASRTQSITDRHSLFIGAFGQLTSDPLLSSQECGFGGATYGRSFEPSIITGDQCFLALAELRYNVPRATIGSLLSYAQFYGFSDYGRIWNIDAPLGTAANDDGASVGGGIRFGKDWLSADLQYAHAIEQPESISSSRDQRVFFKVTAKY